MINIMKNREKSSDLCWILKDYESKISYFKNYITKDVFKKNVMDSNEFKYDLKLLADKSGKSVLELLSEAESLLNLMSHNIGLKSIKVMGYVLSKIIKKMYSNIFVNAIQIEKLRNSFASSNILLLPTHRSYADFLLISYVMFHFNLPIPVIAAAMDFLNMKMIGEFLRACGAFFIKRSFATDELYWTVFSHYIKALVKLSQEPLEFFIEGTRSRTNKSLSPKIGLLGIIFELWLSSYVNIVIVPISISYDKVLEEKLYAWELLGVPKPKESTSGLLKVRHILNENHGNIYFNIGNPISISQLAEMYSVNRFSHNLQLKFKPGLFENEKRFLRYFSRLIVEQQQKCFVVSDWSIILLIFLYYGLNLQQRLTIEKLKELYLEATNLLKVFGAQLAVFCHGHHSSKVSTDDEMVTVTINQALNMYNEVLERDNINIQLIDCGRQTYANITSTEQLDSLIVHRISLGNFRNPILFHLARESILLSRIRCGQNNDLAEIINDVIKTYELLSREFIYCESGKMNFDVALSNLRTSGLLINEWIPNTSHPLYFIVESAVYVHMMAISFYNHVIDTENLIPNTIEQCKSIQNVAKDACMKDVSFAAMFMEICSLDIIRNCICQFNDTLKNKSVSGLQELIASLENCLPNEIKDQLRLIYKTLKL